MSGCVHTDQPVAAREIPAPHDPETAIASAFPQAVVSGIARGTEPWPCPVLHKDKPLAASYRFTVADGRGERAMLACALAKENGAHSWQFYPASIEDDLLTKLHEAMRRYVEMHRERAKAGFYPDGSALGPICLTLTVEACLADQFLREVGIVSEITADQLDSDAYTLIDARGETERDAYPLPGHLDHHVVQYGFDIHDPLALTDLDREAFVDEVVAVREGDSRPLALLCSAGVRSRAAAVALKVAGIHDVVSIKGGLLGNGKDRGLRILQFKGA